jgi:hypothetical protein
MSTTDAEATRRTDPLVGQVLSDRYRVVRKVDERGTATLYAAEHLHAERAVTLLVLDAEHAPESAKTQFLEEARMIARIGHEHIVDVFNGGRLSGGGVFLAMETLDGVSLQAMLRADAPLTWERTQALVGQLASALGAVHRHGVVHRDIKPDNVVLITRGQQRDFVKLRDFGVARLNAAVDTDQGSFTGAPAYMAPEQAQTGPVDQRADIYSLGCVLYEMLTGKPPFEADSILELLDLHLTATPVAPSARRADQGPANTLPAELDAVVLRALEKDPADRWPDMAAFGEALAHCRLTRRQSVRVEALALAEHMTHVRLTALEDRRRLRRRRWKLLAGTVMVLAGVAVVAYRLLTTAPGNVQISTVPPDATLTFNGQPVAARSPLVLEAAPGRYPLVVSRPGYLTAKLQVDVTSLITSTVPVTLAPDPAAPPTAATEPVEP